MDIPRLSRSVSGIYAIICTITGRRYVGSSVCIGKRWSEHRTLLRKGKHHSPRLQNSWNKYGADKHAFVVLEYVPKYRQILLACEQFWMDALEAFHKDFGFNCSWDSGKTTLGIKWSIDVRMKMREAKLGRTKTSPSKETREKVAAALRGRKRNIHTKEWVKKVMKKKRLNKRLGGIQLCFPFPRDRSLVTRNLPARIRD